MQESAPEALELDPPPQKLRAALQRAEAQNPPAYYMDVSCLDENGARSLRVFRSGTSIWNRTTQVVVPAEARKAFLAMMRTADYATMKKSYGGKKKSAGKAALRIRCEVSVDFDGVEKTSVQLADGEQSPRVEGLAKEILDHTASLNLKGEAASDLRDALDKWTSGRLHSEVLNLSIAQIPQNREQDGVIVEVRRGEVRRRKYTPGRGVMDASTAPIDREAVAGVVKAMLAADFDGLPTNLMCEENVEIDVSMLGHRKKVIARKFGRALPAEMADAQSRFDRLLVDLQAFAGRIQEVE